LKKLEQNSIDLPWYAETAELAAKELGSRLWLLDLSHGVRASSEEELDSLSLRDTPLTLIRDPALWALQQIVHWIRRSKQNDRWKSAILRMNCLSVHEINQRLRTLHADDELQQINADDVSGPIYTSVRELMQVTALSTCQIAQSDQYPCRSAGDQNRTR
jgi:hypothetical protein